MKFAVVVILLLTFNLSESLVFSADFSVNIVLNLFFNLLSLIRSILNKSPINIPLTDCSNLVAYTGPQHLIFGRWKAVKTTSDITCEILGVAAVNEMLANATGLSPTTTNFTFYEAGEKKVEEYVEVGNPLSSGHYYVKQLINNASNNVISQVLAVYEVVHLNVSEDTLLSAICPVKPTVEFGAIRIYTRDGETNSEVATYETYAAGITHPFGAFINSNNSNCYATFYE